MRTRRRRLKALKKALLVCAVACAVWLFMAYAYGRIEDEAKRCDALKGYTCTLYDIQSMRK